MTSLVWFRRDLRLNDNPALTAAAQHGKILPLFFLADEDPTHATDPWPTGAAARTWLHVSLATLRDSLRAAGADLHLPPGRAESTLPIFARQTGATALFFNRRHEPHHRQQENTIRQALAPLPIHAYDGGTLRPPESVTTQTGGVCKVFTHFYQRGYLHPFKLVPPPAPLPPPALTAAPPPPTPSLPLPSPAAWGKKILTHWTVGEKAALATAQRFGIHRAQDYAAHRDFPAADGTSRLSPHLHFGELSPRQLWWHIADVNSPYLRQLIWREFSTYLLHHFPDFPNQNWKREFDAFPWREDPNALQKWRHGETGIPIIDAAMRELWQTGYMHNRCRMLVASFLCKNLLIHWHHGAEWFWDCLLDADLANNSAGWQWVAGSGADAAPYFRIFNPVLQSAKFDPKGEYIAKYLPELRHLPPALRHQPWLAVEKTANYPTPIVDLNATRHRALAASAALKNPPFSPRS